MTDDERRRDLWQRAHARTVPYTERAPDPKGDLVLLAQGIRHTGDARLQRRLVERLATQRMEEADDGQ